VERVKTLHVHTAGGGKEYTLHILLAKEVVVKVIHPAQHIPAWVVYPFLYDVGKSNKNAGMPKKSLSSIGIFTSSQRLQSGIGIPASGSIRYHWFRISAALDEGRHSSDEGNTVLLKGKHSSDKGKHSTDEGKHSTVLVAMYLLFSSEEVTPLE
jgi:hypothetical protein